MGKMKEIVRLLHFRPHGFEMQVLGGTVMLIGAITELPVGIASMSVSDTVTKAVGIIRQNIRKPVDIPFLARECHVSISLLAHRFKGEMGCSPMQFARRERVIAAKELFLSGRTVGEASSQLGFKNPFHLSRLFSQIEGVSPMSFRKLSRFKRSHDKKKP
jgi:AraC-like DNA-binding protein